MGTGTGTCNPLLSAVAPIGQKVIADVKPSCGKVLSSGKENLPYLPAHPIVLKTKNLNEGGFTPHGYGDKGLMVSQTESLKLKRPLAEVQMNEQDTHLKQSEQASKITRVDRDIYPVTGYTPSTSTASLSTHTGVTSDSTQGPSSGHQRGSSQDRFHGSEPGPDSDSGIRGGGGVKCVRLVALDVLDDPHNRIKSIACFESTSRRCGLFFLTICVLKKFC
jgi:hypothetical protein